MNYKLMLRMLGRTLQVEALCLIIPMLVALYYQEDPLPFLYTILPVGILGTLLARLRSNAEFFSQEGFTVVGLIWLSFCLFGALPFWFSGEFASFADCFFESASGFTTTGATILTEVEPLTRGGLFWRSFTHWVGGMGVLVFVMAILPMGGDGHGMHMLRAEMPGPAVGKLVSRMSDTAKILYGIYLVMTVIEIVLLLAGGRFKGGDVAGLAPLLKRHVKAAGLYGASREVFENAWKDILPTSWDETLRLALARLRGMARPGDVVLLAPATSSYDQYENYRERGDDFRRAVLEQD